VTVSGSEAFFDPRQTIVHFNNLADERVDARFEDTETRFETGESGVHRRLQTGKPGVQRIDLHHVAQRTHHDREYGHADREIKLRVTHDEFVARLHCLFQNNRFGLLN
jgi:hypothetical protein